jgi:integrase
MVNRKKETEGKPLAQSSQMKVYYMIRFVFKYAVEKGWISEEQIPKLKWSKLNNERKRTFRPKEVHKLIEALIPKSTEVAEIVMLSAYCGMRQSEIFNLTWGDLDFQNNTLNVIDAKSESGVRELSMTKTVRELLNARDTDENWKRSKYVFPDADGNKRRFMSKTYFRTLEEVFPGNAEQPKAFRLDFHSLRGACATTLARAGVQQKAIMQILGHSTGEMTRRYINLDDRDRAEALQKAADLFDQASLQ